MSDHQHRRLPPSLSFNRLAPNIITLLALASGLTGIRFAIMESFERAVALIVIAAIFDTLDGRVARMLKGTSKFGAELDSLSDAISFGVAPALIMYQWLLLKAGGLGWIAVLIFAIGAALRLARFNTMSDAAEENPATAPAFTKGFFVGVPAPAGAGLALMPLIFMLEWPDLNIDAYPKFVAVWLMLVAGLMVSRWPTFSLKGRKVPLGLVVPVMLIAVLIAAGLVLDTWVTLSIVGSAYAGLLPFSFVSFRLQRRKYLAALATSQALKEAPPQS